MTSSSPMRTARRVTRPLSSRLTTCGGTGGGGPSNPSGSSPTNVPLSKTPPSACPAASARSCEVCCPAAAVAVARHSTSGSTSRASRSENAVIMIRSEKRRIGPRNSILLRGSGIDDDARRRTVAGDTESQSASTDPPRANSGMLVPRIALFQRTSHVALAGYERWSTRLDHGRAPGRLDCRSGRPGRREPAHLARRRRDRRTAVPDALRPVPRARRLGRRRAEPPARPVPAGPERRRALPGDYRRRVRHAHAADLERPDG